MDTMLVSHYQGTINWSTVKNNGVKFVFIKATEGTSKCALPRRPAPHTHRAHSLHGP